MGRHHLFRTQLKLTRVTYMDASACNRRFDGSLPHLSPPCPPHTQPQTLAPEGASPTYLPLTSPCTRGRRKVVSLPLRAFKVKRPMHPCKPRRLINLPWNTLYPPPFPHLCLHFSPMTRKPHSPAPELSARSTPHLCFCGGSSPILEPTGEVVQYVHLNVSCGPR